MHHGTTKSLPVIITGSVYRLFQANIPQSEILNDWRSAAFADVYEQCSHSVVEYITPVDLTGTMCKADPVPYLQNPGWEPHVLSNPHSFLKMSLILSPSCAFGTPLISTLPTFRRVDSVKLSLFSSCILLLLTKIPQVLTPAYVHGKTSPGILWAGLVSSHLGEISHSVFSFFC